MPPLPEVFYGKLSPLDVCVPKDFEKTMGCLCITAYVAFVPNVNGTSVVYDNGAFDGPVKLGPWRAWASQPLVARVLRENRLFDDRPPFRALLLDTARRRLWVTDEEDVQDFLRIHLAEVNGRPEI